METPPLQPGPSGGSPGTHLCFCLTDAHSLCLDLAVTSQSRPGQPWCEVQGSMDTKPLLQYDSDSNQVTASDSLGKKVNGTKAWSDLTGTLGGVGRDLRTVLPDIQLGTEEARGEYGEGVGGWGQ